MNIKQGIKRAENRSDLHGYFLPGGGFTASKEKASMFMRANLVGYNKLRLYRPDGSRVSLHEAARGFDNG